MSADTEVEQIKRKLIEQRTKLWDAAQEFTPEEFTRPRDGGWSVKDILAHLAIAEAINVKFARLMLAHDYPVQVREMARDFPDYAGPFSLDDFNTYMTAQLQAQSAEEVLNNFHTTRAETLIWIQTLTPEQLARGGQHAAWGDQTVRGMLKILMLHDKMHTQDILKRKVES